MPIVNIKTMKGALDEAQKKLLHKRLADLFVEIEGNGNEALRKYVIVKIEEDEMENWSIGGIQPRRGFIKQIT